MKLEHKNETKFVSRRILYSLIIFAIAFPMPAASDLPFGHPPAPAASCDPPCGLFGYMMLQPMGSLLWLQPTLATIAYIRQRRIRKLDPTTAKLLIATGTVVFFWLPVYFGVSTLSTTVLDPYLIIGLLQTSFAGVLLLLLAPGGWLFLLSTGILVHAGLRTRELLKRTP